MNFNLYFDNKIPSNVQPYNSCRNKVISIYKSKYIIDLYFKSNMRYHAVEVFKLKSKMLLLS